VGQIEKTSPDKTKLELSKGRPSVTTSKQASGLSIGVPKLGVGIPKIEAKNAIKTKKGDLRSGLVNESIEKALINNDTKTTGKKILEKQLRSTGNEALKVTAADPRLAKAAAIATKVSNTKVKTKKSTEKISNKLKNKKTASENATPEEDLFLSKERTATIKAPISDLVKKMPPPKRGRKPKPKNIDQAINALEELVEISVGKPVTKEKTTQINDVAFVPIKKVSEMSKKSKRRRKTFAKRKKEKVTQKTKPQKKTAKINPVGPTLPSQGPLGGGY
jgi:hypothetical protein